MNEKWKALLFWLPIVTILVSSFWIRLLVIYDLEFSKKYHRRAAELAIQYINSQEELCQSQVKK